MQQRVSIWRVIDIYSKYALVILLKDENVSNAFCKIIDESGRKPSKIWVDKGSKFGNRSIKFWLQNNDTEIYSTHNEGKSVVSERFGRNLEPKFINIWLLCWKNIYIDKLADIVNNYNNTYHSTVKMKPADVQSSTYIDLTKKIMKNITNFNLQTM